MRRLQVFRTKLRREGSFEREEESLVTLTVRVYAKKRKKGGSGIFGGLEALVGDLEGESQGVSYATAGCYHYDAIGSNRCIVIGEHSENGASCPVGG